MNQAVKAESPKLKKKKKKAGKAAMFEEHPTFQPPDLETTQVIYSKLRNTPTMVEQATLTE